MWKDNLRYMAWALVLIGLLGVLPAAAAETGTIAFMSTRDGTLAVYTMNPDASGQTRLTDGLHRDFDPAWSPDGSRIAFTSDRDAVDYDGNFEIYVMNAGGTEQERLTTTTAWEGMASWSPDGTRIAFASGRDGNNHIYVMNADGSDQTPLTSGPGSDVDPAWSPDGTRIAFTSDRDGDAEVFVMNADGTGQVQLTDNGAWDGTAAWSPDGSRIAFTSDREGDNEIYVMNADGTGETRYTVNPGEDCAPAWSPDGSRIAFQSDRGDNVDIYVMNADGSGQAPLTTDAAYDGTPAWCGDARDEPSPPDVAGVTVPSGPVAVQSPVSATATITDTGSADTHTATWTWGDGTTSGGIVAGGSVAGTHAYSSAGVYRVTVTVTDDDGESGTATAPAFVVAYDPNGGFVTGGGWVRSPAGAYLADPALTGPAAFGFMSRYSAGSGKKGGPMAGLQETPELLFRLGDLNFESTSYEKQVVGGAKASFRGKGTINEKGAYGFQLYAIDGQQRGGDGTDRFRIRIWDQASGRTVYDNQAGAGDTADPATAISGGAITIAKP